MSTPVLFNSISYNVPAYGDTGYAQGAGNLSSYLIAIASGTLQQSGGTFSLIADVNFGATFGLLSKYFTSVTANAATAGSLRLAHADTIDWRNNANSGNLALSVNSSDQLLYNGVVVSTGTSFVTSITGTANEIIASSSTGAVTLSTPQAIATTSSPTFAGLTTAVGNTFNSNAYLLSGNTIELTSGHALVFDGGTSGALTLSANPVTASYALTWPAAQASGTQVLQNNGSGFLSWATPVVTAVGNLTDAGTDGIVITGGTGAVVGSGTSLAQHVADSTHNGYLSSVDWSTFNSKGTGTVTSVSGTTNQILSTGGTTPVLSLPSTVILTQGITLGSGGGANGKLEIFNATNSNTVDVLAGITGSNYQLLLPTGPGSTGNVLTANVSGSVNTLSWSVPTAGTVTSVSGTANQITSTGGATPVLALASPLTTPGAATITGTLSASVGSTFGNAASPSATTLNYYGEGTWTPTINFGGATTGITYSQRIGRYTRIGRLVQWEIRIILSSKGSATGSATITGLPFTAGSRAYATPFFNTVSGITGQTNIEIDTVTLFLGQLVLNTNTGLDNTNFTNTTTFNATGTYSL